MSESPQGERDRSESVVEEDKEEENEIDEVERQSEGSGGIHDELIDAIARGTEDQEVLREQDRYLPICNIARVMRRMVPESGKMSKESKEAIQEAVSEFISFITSEASDKCIEEQRKTITCDDLLNAIEVMGFEKYVEPLKLFMTRYREATRADRPPGEGGDTRTPSPPSPPISTPLLIPTPAPFPSSLASGPGGPIQPAPSLSSTTALFNTGTGPMRISLPPGYSIGEKEMFKGLSKQRSLNGQEMNPPPSGSSGMGGEEEMEMGVNGHPHQLISIHPKQGSSESPITIFVDQNTGQKYRNVVGQDGTQRLAPIRSNQNIKVIRRPHPSSSTLPIDSPQAHPIGPSSSSSISDHQSPLISSTTTTPQFPSQSHYHPQVTTHLSYSGQNHSHPSHHSQYHPVSFHDSSSSSIHSSMPPPPPPPPSTLSTNYIQLMPHSSIPSSFAPPTTTSHLQYSHYQEQPLMSVSDGEGGKGGTEEKKEMTSSIANAKWNPSSGQYVVDAPKIGGGGGTIPTKRRRINNGGQ